MGQCKRCGDVFSVTQMHNGYCNDCWAIVESEMELKKKDDKRGNVLKGTCMNCGKVFPADQLYNGYCHDCQAVAKEKHNIQKENHFQSSDSSDNLQKNSNDSAKQKTKSHGALSTFIVHFHQTFIEILLWVLLVLAILIGIALGVQAGTSLGVQSEILKDPFVSGALGAVGGGLVWLVLVVILVGPFLLLGDIRRRVESIEDVAYQK